MALNARALQAGNLRSRSQSPPPAPCFPLEDPQGQAVLKEGRMEDPGSQRQLRSMPPAPHTQPSTEPAPASQPACQDLSPNRPS